ncbi:UDP-glycosyltransferase 89B1 [Carex littledalei]|uniref:UDP-glycosyltransferase 89B1 n=1 Tax=Carex littledalei TaxID=544730 RepID=A0A833VS69_9POAL|nr:UDP-glycosyltransferase 89B1 [Carex littledalei]
MAKPRQPPHILLIPFPAQGHIIPFLDFSHHLSLQNFSLTIVVTPSNLTLLSPLLSLSPSIQTLSLPFPSSPHLPPNVENSKDLPPSSFSLFIHALAGLYSPILSWIKSQTDNPVSAIVSDFFLGWTQPLAKEVGVPRIAFSSSAVFGTAVLHSLFRRLPQRLDSTDDLELISFAEIPGSPVFPFRELSFLYRSYREGDPVSEAVRQNFLWNFDSWGFASNTFKALEGAYLEHPLVDLGFRKIWTVGPLTPIDCGINRGGVMSGSASEVVTWLDRWDEKSVLYISFGSQAVLPRMQAMVLATALEKSGVHFVWAMRDSTILPEGFEERIADKGMIIKGWAPQVAILSHCAVGWFITHCGWNSVLEALTAGVTILTWPMAADQFVNARLLVESTRVAIPVWEGSSEVPQEEELAKVLKETVSLKGTEVQNRAKEMGREAAQAVREGGSSYQELEGLMQELWKLEVKQVN